MLFACLLLFFFFFFFFFRIKAINFGIGIFLLIHLQNFSSSSVNATEFIFAGFPILIFVGFNNLLADFLLKSFLWSIRVVNGRLLIIRLAQLSPLTLVVIFIFLLNFFTVSTAFLYKILLSLHWLTYMIISLLFYFGQPTINFGVHRKIRAHVFCKNDYHEIITISTRIPDQLSNFFLSFFCSYYLIFLFPLYPS